MKKKLVYLVTISFAVMFLLLTPVPVKAADITAETAQINTDVSIQRADIIDWRFKIEDGKMYKRLYNYSKSVWVGDWILCP